MSKAKSVEVEVLPPEKAVAVVPLRDRRDRIVTYHTGSKRSAQQQIVYAFLCGLELVQTKEQLGHGKFLPWCKDNLPDDCSQRTATNYMRFADVVQERLLS